MASEKQESTDAAAMPPALLPPLCPPAARLAWKPVTAASSGPEGGSSVRLHSWGRDPPGPGRQSALPNPGSCHRGMGQHAGEPFTLRGLGEDTPRRFPKKRHTARGGTARRERVSRRGALPRLLRGKTPHSPPPQESAMLGRPPSPRSPRSRQPHSPPAPCGAGENRERRRRRGPGLGSRPPPPASPPLTHRAVRHVSAAAADPSARRPPGRGEPGSHSPVPRAAVPHCPAPRCASGREGASALTHPARSPSAAAGSSRSRPTPPYDRRKDSRKNRPHIPSRPARPRRLCPPGAPPPFPGAAATTASSPPCTEGTRACSPRSPVREIPFHFLPPPVSRDAPARSGTQGGRRRLPPARRYPRGGSPGPAGGRRRRDPRYQYSREITARKIW